MTTINYDEFSVTRVTDCNRIQYQYDIDGYWSDSNLTLEFRRRIGGAEWTPVISYPSGGYEPDYDPIQRAKNLSEALKHAIGVAELQLENPDRLNYLSDKAQAEWAAADKRQRAEAEEHRAKLKAADPENDSTEWLDETLKQIRGTERVAFVMLYSPSLEEEVKPRMLMQICGNTYDNRLDLHFWKEDQRRGGFRPDHGHSRSPSQKGLKGAWMQCSKRRTRVHTFANLDRFSQWIELQGRKEAA